MPLLISLLLNWVDNMFKKILTLAIVIGALLTASIAYAGPDINSLTNKVASSSGFETAGVTDTSLSETIGGLIRVVLSMAGIVFLALTVYAGILWMTAGGNDERVEKATKIFTRSTIGLILVISSYSLAYFGMMFILKTNEQEIVGGTAQSSSAGNKFKQGFKGGVKDWWSGKQ